MPLPAALRPYLQTPDTFNITAAQLGTAIRRPMPFGGTVARYLIRLTGTLTVGVAVATVLEDSPYGLIRDLQVVINGGKTIRAHPARFIQFLNFIQHGTGKRVTAPGGAIGATNFMAEWEIDFSQYDLRGLEHYFVQDTRATTGLDLVFQVGDANDVATPGGGGTVALSNLVMTIQPEELAGLGGYASRIEIARMPRLSGGIGRLVINDIPALGQIYRAIVLHTVSHATLTDPIRQTGDDTIITDVTLRAGVRTHYDATPWQAIQADNKGIFHVETWRPGWAVLDFARNKDLTQLLRTRATRQLTLDLNIGAAPANGNLEIYPIGMQLLVG